MNTKHHPSALTSHCIFTMFTIDSCGSGGPEGFSDLPKVRISNKEPTLDLSLPVCKSLSQSQFWGCGSISFCLILTSTGLLVEVFCLFLWLKTFCPWPWNRSVSTVLCGRANKEVLVETYFGGSCRYLLKHMDYRLFLSEK